ncbi:MAG: M3 family metallopeptidase, partial [Halobacteria archaeon]|nr:M3 family metallopeptidase [Halobacteria archaeon]
EFRLHVLNEFLERIRSTLYRQTMFADFEHQAHSIVGEGGALTPDKLDELYHGLKSEYYEPAVMDERIGREWMRIPHFYRSFYVYQYATGISAAVALADRVLNKGEEAAQDYLNFLRSGSSKYSLDLLKDAGVDMSSPEPIESAISVYSDYLDEMEAIIE